MSIFDCAVWHDEYAHLLRLTHPRAIVTVQSCSISLSLSGLEVRVREGDAAGASYLRLVVAALVAMSSLVAWGWLVHNA